MVIFPSSLRFAEPSLLSRTDLSIRRGQSAMSASLIQATMALLSLVASSSSSSISPSNAASHPVASSTATRDPRRRRRPSPHLYPRRFTSAEDVALSRPPPPILIPHGRDVRQAIPTPHTNFASSHPPPCTPSYPAAAPLPPAAASRRAADSASSACTWLETSKAYG
jgi:hypothetical protein